MYLPDSSLTSAHFAAIGAVAKLVFIASTSTTSLYLAAGIACPFTKLASFASLWSGVIRTDAVLFWITSSRIITLNHTARFACVVTKPFATFTCSIRVFNLKVHYAFRTIKVSYFCNLEVNIKIINIFS